jgi:hypothetical protein
MQSLEVFGKAPASVASMTGLPWIVSKNVNAK